MTHATRTTLQHTRAAVPRLLVALLLAAGIFGAATLDQGGQADAAPRSKSAVVAAEADHALAALATWQSTNSPAAYVEFVQARQRTASLAANDLEVAASQLSQEWQAASTTKQRAVLAALSQLGVPYRSLKSLPGVGFDCSGLTIWAFDQAGLDIPRTSRDQFRAGDEIERAEAGPGDLVYYPGHVGIYLGAGTMVHSPNSGSHVEAVGLPSRRSLRFAHIALDNADDPAASIIELLSAALMNGAGAVPQ